MLVGGAVLLVVALALGIPQDLYARYRAVPIFNARFADEFWYYHVWYALFYPTLWTLVGVLSLIALCVAPRPASLALVLFVTSFLLNSFAAPKGLRYLAYAQPFLFILWGIALAYLLAHARSAIAWLTARLGRVLPLPPLWAKRASWGLVAGALAVLVLGNPAWIRTTALLADVTIPPEKPPADWRGAKPHLEPYLERVDVVLTTEELGMLYFLGRYDIRFSPSKMQETWPEERHEFGLDMRTGRPVIASADAVELLVRCRPSGLIVGPAADWGKPHLINSEVAARIKLLTRPIELPERLHMYAYRWERGTADPEACAAIKAYKTDGKAS